MTNIMRDECVRSELNELGWHPVVISECETRNPDLPDIIRYRLRSK
jgi:G:T-mismatch repair DNA endonuclease (very short patch repair protein)